MVSYTLLIMLIALSVSFCYILMGRGGFYSQRDRADELERRLGKVNHTLSSVRVKHGQAWETFIPLMKIFEEALGAKENAVFLGQPLDLIYFNNNEILFVEVKTGKSSLSKKQRKIKNLIRDKKVRWVEVNDTLESQ